MKIYLEKTLERCTEIPVGVGPGLKEAMGLVGQPSLTSGYFAPAYPTSPKAMGHRRDGRLCCKSGIYCEDAIIIIRMQQTHSRKAGVSAYRSQKYPLDSPGVPDNREDTVDGWGV